MKLSGLCFMAGLVLSLVTGAAADAVNTHPLVAATYFGGSAVDQGWPSTPSIIDAEGNIVFVISTSSSGLATSGAYDVSSNGGGDVLVVKMNPQLTSVLAATYLGGNASDSPSSIGIDNGGHIYIGGTTSSSNFPTSPGAYDRTFVGGEGFVAEFSADLDTLLASTFIGGNASDGVDDIALSADGSVFAVVETGSTDLITSPGAIRGSYYGGTSDYYVIRLNSALTIAPAATYLGGNREDWGARLHLDAAGDIYVTGSTFSTNVPMTPGAFDAVNGGNSLDGIIMHLNKDLTTILASTYIGGNSPDWIYCVDLAKNGDIYISGHADYQWPVTPGCFDSTYNGGPAGQGSDSYVARMSADLTTLKASTYLGGAAWDWGVDIAVDSNDLVYVVGETVSPDFPLTPDAYDKTRGDTTEMFIAILDSTMGRLHMSTFIGGAGADRWPGVLLDDSNRIYVIGYTESSDLATTLGAYDGSYNGGGDIYVAEFAFDPFTRITDLAPVTEPECASGAYWADYDNDTYPDLFVTRWWQSGSHLDALYHNNGDATFTKVADQIPSQEGDALGATWGDYDNDGHEDLFVARPRLNSPGAENYLYHNGGDGSFTKVTASPPATDQGTSTHTAFADLDDDGDLDLFVSYHNIPVPTGGLGLYRNEGRGTFVRLANGDVGLDSDDCGAIGIADYDGDGYPDLVHARNMLTSLSYTNDGDGTFTSVDNPVSADSTRAFGWGDYDNDGDLDLCGGDDWAQGLILYRNDGSGLFTRLPVDPGDTTGTIMRKPYWVDYDNDGDLDLFVLKQGAAYAPAQAALYINQGDGTFYKKEMSVIVTDSGSSSGAAWADYDRDGDLDVFIANTNSSLSAFYRNDVGNANNWISIKCVGTTSNRSGIGAKVRVKAHSGGRDVWQLREIAGQSGFFGQDEMRAHFGLGDAANIDSLQVVWPSGKISVLTDVAPNQFLTITEFRCGDANGDWTINVGDAVFVINYIFKSGPAPNPIEAGDANCDGARNVGDAVYVINYIFKSGPAPCCP